MFLFRETLIHRPSFRLQRLAPIESTLFRSAHILRRTGFNALHIDERFYGSPEGQRTSRPQAVADYFAKARSDDSLEDKKAAGLAGLTENQPGQF